MSGAELALVASVFLACAVEATEALTIVLAVGTTRSWPASLYGCTVALLVLSAGVAAFGPALARLPVDALRLAIGALLLAFGLHWLRKAVLRAAGLKAQRDEQVAFESARASALATRARTVAGIDAYAFVVAFKGVLLEGIEVVVIVLSLGANQHRVSLAAVAALAAVALVALVGVAARAPLTRVPENAMKLAVGVMLVSFGVFWAAQGAGAAWPGDDAALLAIVPGVALAALATTLRLRRTPSPVAVRVEE